MLDKYSIKETIIEYINLRHMDIYFIIVKNKMVIFLQMALNYKLILISFHKHLFNGAYHSSKDHIIYSFTKVAFRSGK